MDMNKCMASEDGICRNVYGFGTECNGYSDKCALKQYYDTAERIVKGINKALKINLGIKGDNE